MKLQKNILLYMAVAAVILAMMTNEVEGRRKILKGRKTITRTYLSKMALPAWAIIVLVGLGEIIVGALVYLLMKKMIIDPPVTGSYTPAPLGPIDA